MKTIANSEFIPGFDLAQTFFYSKLINKWIKNTKMNYPIKGNQLVNKKKMKKLITKPLKIGSKIAFKVIHRLRFCYSSPAQ